MAKGKKATRFDVISKYYMAVSTGIQPLEQAKQNIAMLEYKIFESEIEKFGAEFPDINLDDFRAFLKSVDAYKVGGKKAGTGTGERKTYIDSVEKATEVGVAPENMEAYLALVHQVQPLVKQLNALCTKGRVSFAIPVLKEKEVVA